MSKFDEVFTSLNGLPYMSTRQALKLRDTIIENSAKNILEIGFFHGKSSVLIGAILEDFGQGHLLTVDKQSAMRRNPNINELLQKHCLSHRVTPVLAKRSYTWELQKLIRSSPRQQFDLCYFDGGHTWDNTGFGFFLVDMLLRPGGILILDDLDWTLLKSPSVRREPERLRIYSDDEIETPAVRLVWDLLLPRQNYRHLEVASELGWGIAQKPA